MFFVLLLRLTIKWWWMMIRWYSKWKHNKSTEQEKKFFSDFISMKSIYIFVSVFYAVCVFSKSKTWFSCWKNYTLSRCNIRIKKHTWIGLRRNDMLNMQIHTKNNILMFNHLIAFFSFFMTLKKWQHCKNKQRVFQKIYSLSII